MSRFFGLLPYRILFVIFLISKVVIATPQNELTVDICIYGATPAGVMAAVAAKKMGHTVLIVTPEKVIGGMLSNGLASIDIAGKRTVTGLARDFFRRMGNYYGTFEKWTFEPHVAEQVFGDYLNENRTTLLRQYRVVNVRKNGEVLEHILLENVGDTANCAQKLVSAKIFIDCSYEGDLLAHAGITHIIGREGNEKYSEDFNGLQLGAHNQLPAGIDPYFVAGDSSSGLICEQAHLERLQNGQFDTELPAFGMRLCLTDDPANFRKIVKPAGYDAAAYELLRRIWEKNSLHDLRQAFNFKVLPNRKFELNSSGPSSLDAIGLNAGFFNLSYDARQQVLQKHHDYVRGLLYFYASDESVPQKIRTKLQKWGLPRDEFVDNDNWPREIYIREGRRMLGEYTMTESNVFGRARVPDVIARAAGAINMHHAQRLVVDGMLKNEGSLRVRIDQPWAISYRAITPRREEATNLLVPVCLSASHSAWSSLRTEPVFMMTGQAAGIAAALAIEETAFVQNINFAKLQKILHENPYLDGRAGETVLYANSPEFSIQNGRWQEKAPDFPLKYSEQVFVAASDSLHASASFSAEIVRSGRYHIYFYRRNYDTFAAVGKKTITAKITIVANGQKKDKLCNMATGNDDWIDLGIFPLRTGETCRIIISTGSKPTLLIADTVLLQPCF